MVITYERNIRMYLCGGFERCHVNLVLGMRAIIDENKVPRYFLD